MAQTQTWLLSPTEHHLQTLLTNNNFTYRISNLCEPNGVDIITKSSKGLIGFQRKTLSDLKASIQDGRLYKEIAQMTNSVILTYSFIIIEHTPKQVTIAGTFLDVDFPRINYLSILTKLQLLHVGYFQSSSLPDTFTIANHATNYISSSSSLTLRRTKDNKDQWGSSSHRDYMEFLVQSFPGVGPKLAKNIVNYFGGYLPLIWTIDEEELLNIPGIGLSLAKKLYEFFNSSALTPA